MSNRERQMQRGIALVIVLWMLALLTVIAGSLVFSSRTEVQIAANLASRAQAEALADAGVARALAEMAQPKSGDPKQWRADGLPRHWNYRGAELTITIIDESGKIDINAAPPVLLASLFRSVGAEDPEALADAVADWRDGDDLRSLHGAEKDDYAAAGLNYGPANTAFESIDELRQVLGFNDDLFRLVERSITVYSFQPAVNTAVAPREVLLALPGATPEQVDAYVEQRQSLLEQGLPVPPFAGGQGFSASVQTSTYSIQVEAVLGDNIRFLRGAVARLNNNAQEAPAILAWRSLATGGAPIAASNSP